MHVATWKKLKEKHGAEWKKPDVKDYVLCDPMYMQCAERAPLGGIKLLLTGHLLFARRDLVSLLQ